MFTNVNSLSLHSMFPTQILAKKYVSNVVNQDIIRSLCFTLHIEF